MASSAQQSSAATSFTTEGYCVIENFASAEECAALRGRMAEMVDKDFDPEAVRSVFTTKEQTRTTDSYFLDSSENVSYFLEEGLPADAPKERVLNKVGHALHELDPAFRQWSRSDKVASLMRELGYAKPTPVQSMYIFKHPAIGGAVDCHQDSTFLYTDRPSCTGLWLALEDATVDNGCLWALPGSHADGSGLARRFVRNAEAREDATKEPVVMTADCPDYDLSKFKALPVKAGSLVCLHGALVHMSHPNTSAKSRHAYSVHFVEAGRGVEWTKDNWLQRPSGKVPFEALYDDDGNRDDKPAWEHEAVCRGLEVEV